MHPEIEKLIDLVITDGTISEKEKNVIIKKATEFGLDLDEVEVVLDGKLQQFSLNKRIQKLGNISACPACGAIIKALELTCSLCEHDFTNISANRTSTKFEKELKIHREKFFETGLKNGLTELRINYNFDKQELPRFIKNFPIPNTKEDLFETLTYFSSRVLTSTQFDSEEINSCHAKSLEIIMKFKLTPHIESNIIDQVNIIEQQMSEVKKKNATNKWIYSILGFFIIYIIYAFIAKLNGNSIWPFR
jgi:hypothetical protein